MDLIEDETCFYLVVALKGQHTLRSILKQIPQSSEEFEDFARETVKRVAKIVERMHNKKVMHRGLNLKSIMMNQDKKGLKVACINNFDFALHLQNRWMVKQQFLVEGEMMPPEVVSGEAQDVRVDIWSLGQIIYQILSKPSGSRHLQLLSQNEKAHWLPFVNEEVKALAESMTDPDMEQRPLISEVLCNSWLTQKS